MESVVLLSEWFVFKKFTHLNVHIISAIQTLKKLVIIKRFTRIDWFVISCYVQEHWASVLIAAVMLSVVDTYVIFLQNIITLQCIVELHTTFVVTILLSGSGMSDYTMSKKMRLNSCP